jgi:hypothetical protein
MWRYICRHEAYFGVERFASFPGHAQVCVVDRIERAAEDGYGLH